ncbi:hypothetical protein [Pandoraea terrigena]|uniref:hypothetical protein n=1 Tax=Pandoraea terrigena TaxID=2508292 RepID=UPI00123F7C9C|nr:hypothetical protein [Pandoraea terrigena]
MARIFERTTSPRASFRIPSAPADPDVPPQITPPTLPALRRVGGANGQSRTFDVAPYASFWRNALAGAFTLRPSDDRR